jgi:hypothetical protein
MADRTERVPAFRSRQERRGALSPVPDDLDTLLTDPQRQALRRMARFSWAMLFVRRGQAFPPTVVLSDPSGTLLASVEGDGRYRVMLQTEVRPVSAPPA